MRHLVLLASIALALTTRNATATEEQVPSVAQLPKGAPLLDAVPKDPPAEIPASETLEGVFIVAQRHDAPDSYGFTVTVDPSVADWNRARTPGAPAVRDDSRCLLTSRSNEKGGPAWWPDYATQSWMAFYENRRGSEPRLQPLRIERLIVARGPTEKPALEVTLAWVDVKTGGIRLISKRQQELIRIARGPALVDVFGMRSDVGIDLVVAAPILEGEVPAHGPLEVRASNVEQQAVSSSCAHVRIHLRVDPGVSEMVNVMATIGQIARRAPDEERDLGDTTVFTSLRVSVSSSWLTHELTPMMHVSMGWN